MTKLNILVVDDDEAMLLLIKDLFEICGHNVSTASSGARALELMKNQGYDLLLTDYQMPGMTGLQLLEQVKLISTAYLWLWSGTLTDDIIVRAKAMGVKHIFLKPVEMKTLLDALSADFQIEVAA